MARLSSGTHISTAVLDGDTGPTAVPRKSMKGGEYENQRKQSQRLESDLAVVNTTAVFAETVVNPTLSLTPGDGVSTVVPGSTNESNAAEEFSRFDDENERNLVVTNAVLINPSEGVGCYAGCVRDQHRGGILVTVIVLTLVRSPRNGLTKRTACRS